MLDLPTYNRYFKAKSKMALAVAKSEASMNAAISFHEGTESKDETKSGGKQANSLIQSLGDNKHHEGISAVVSASKMARKLSLKLKRRHDIVERKEGDLSFAERVRKGGRPKKAIEAYRRSALVDLFAMMDHDMGGTVDEEELTQFLISLFAPNSSKLSDTEIRQIELMIAGLDENGDGEVSVQEFLNVMEPIVAQMEEEETPEQITARMWDVLDSDSSGSVSISEFRDVLAKVGLTMSYEEVRELFAEFDDDGSGALDLDELLSFMKSQI
jgi:Ca2+-binding EF-hand superfamily protein